MTPCGVAGCSHPSFTTIGKTEVELLRCYPSYPINFTKKQASPVCGPHLVGALSRLRRETINRVVRHTQPNRALATREFFADILAFIDHTSTRVWPDGVDAPPQTFASKSTQTSPADFPPPRNPEDMLPYLLAILLPLIPYMCFTWCFLFVTCHVILKALGLLPDAPGLGNDVWMTRPGQEIKRFFRYLLPFMPNGLLAMLRGHGSCDGGNRYCRATSTHRVGVSRARTFRHFTPISNGPM